MSEFDIETYMAEKAKKEEACYQLLRRLVEDGYFVPCLTDTRSRRDGIDALKKAYRASYSSTGYEGSARGLTLSGYDADGGTFSELLTWAEAYDLIICALLSLQGAEDV